MTSPRDIPSIEQLRQRPAVRALEAAYGRDAVVTALRAEADALRGMFAEGRPAPPDLATAIERAVPGRLQEGYAPSLTAVINATGVIVHTNLGRAPLARVAAERVAALASGYSNLEYDVAAGRRGHRDAHAEKLLCRLTGAAAAVVVNNNAAAAMLAVAGLAAGREVLISRGELVEIGGAFRVPEVLAQSGARLREVGTTNRTRVSDYAAAISDRTGLILRVHPSNFRIEGFTERPALGALVALGRQFAVPVVEDQGSGYLGFAAGCPALEDEPDVRASVAAGADLVLFSGDKLLGGPQSGILVGTNAGVARLRRHPLMRALRVGKMTLAALEATLGEFLAGRASDSVPVAAMIGLTPETLGSRAEAVASRLRGAGIGASVADGHSTVGGGSAPGSALPTRIVRIDAPGTSADALEAALRRGRTPLVARIENDRVVIDLRTVPPGQDDLVASLVIEAASRPAP